MSKIALFLWFDGCAEEAAEFYVSTFRDCGHEAGVGKIMRHGAEGPGPAGGVMSVTFTLGDQEFIAFNGGPNFTFSPAISLFVKCTNQDELDDFWGALSEDGKTIQCGWLSDKFGITWQIVPTVLGDMLSDPDPARAQRVMKAMMRMIKLDIGELQDAYDGADD